MGQPERQVDRSDAGRLARCASEASASGTLLETLASRGRDELVAATKAAVERALENEMQAGRTTVDAATFDTVLLAASEAQEEYLGTWVCRYNHRNNRTEWHDGSAFTGIPCVFV